MGAAAHKFVNRLTHDANMGALGESRYGEGHDVEDLIYVKIGTGIGVGLITERTSCSCLGALAAQRQRNQNRHC